MVAFFSSVSCLACCDEYDIDWCTYLADPSTTVTNKATRGTTAHRAARCAIAHRAAKVGKFLPNILNSVFLVFRSAVRDVFHCFDLTIYETGEQLEGVSASCSRLHQTRCSLAPLSACICVDMLPH
mmetsp:Transcript_27054/g.38714  ORF Transcript_27054/g.38714 Transcript_27054/m.38714 type:complete len:126 (-) Transcript_27054:89-466(-)